MLRKKGVWPFTACIYAIVFLASSNAAPASQELAITEYYSESNGCYYNFERYEEGDRIVTNEPCLNCTCHNRMLMCFLRVCPFTKAIGQDCTVVKSPDQCCPVITCPEVPVQLLVTRASTEASSTTVAAHTSSTQVGFRDDYGCVMRDNVFYADGAQVPINSAKPCELCYCIRNHTACVMQQCTLHVEGCHPIYQEGVCCPVRYDCDADTDKSTTFWPNMFSSTTWSPSGADCVYNGEIYNDGELITTEKPCEHCYCMRGDIVCAVQDCGEPLRGIDCTPSVPLPQKCCPSSYSCGNETLTTISDLIKDYSSTSSTPPHSTTYEDPYTKLGENFPNNDTEMKKHPSEWIDLPKPTQDDVDERVSTETTRSDGKPTIASGDLVTVTSSESPLLSSESSFSPTDPSHLYESSSLLQDESSSLSPNLGDNAESYPATSSEGNYNVVTTKVQIDNDSENSEKPLNDDVAPEELPNFTEPKEPNLVQPPEPAVHDQPIETSTILEKGRPSSSAETVTTYPDRISQTTDYSTIHGIDSAEYSTASLSDKNYSSTSDDEPSDTTPIYTTEQNIDVVNTSDSGEVNNLVHPHDNTIASTEDTPYSTPNVDQHQSVDTSITTLITSTERDQRTTNIMTSVDSKPTEILQDESVSTTTASIEYENDANKPDGTTISSEDSKLGQPEKDQLLNATKITNQDEILLTTLTPADSKLGEYPQDHSSTTIASQYEDEPISTPLSLTTMTFMPDKLSSTPVDYVQDESKTTTAISVDTKLGEYPQDSTISTTMQPIQDDISATVQATSDSKLKEDAHGEISSTTIIPDSVEFSNTAESPTDTKVNEPSQDQPLDIERIPPNDMTPSINESKLEVPSKDQLSGTTYAPTTESKNNDLTDGTTAIPVDTNNKVTESQVYIQNEPAETTLYPVEENTETISESHKPDTKPDLHEEYDNSTKINMFPSDNKPGTASPSDGTTTTYNNIQPDELNEPAHNTIDTDPKLNEHGIILTETTTETLNHSENESPFTTQPSATNKPSTSPFKINDLLESSVTVSYKQPENLNKGQYAPTTNLPNDDQADNTIGPLAQDEVSPFEGSGDNTSEEYSETTISSQNKIILDGLPGHVTSQSSVYNNDSTKIPNKNDTSESTLKTADETTTIASFGTDTLMHENSQDNKLGDADFATTEQPEISKFGPPQSDSQYSTSSKPFTKPVPKPATEPSFGYPLPPHASQDEPDTIHENEGTTDISEEKPFKSDSNETDSSKPGTVEVSTTHQMEGEKNTSTESVTRQKETTMEPNEDNHEIRTTPQMEDEKTTVESVTHYQKETTIKPYEGKHTEADTAIFQKLGIPSNTSAHITTESEPQYNNSSEEMYTTYRPIQDKLHEYETFTEYSPEQVITDRNQADDESHSHETSSELLEESVTLPPPTAESTGIPGEGSCLVDGATYANSSVIKSNHPCHIRCICMSSIPTCTVLSCPPPPKDNQKCNPIYMKDACCPVYVCDGQEGSTTANWENQDKVSSYDAIAESQTSSSVQPNKLESSTQPEGITNANSEREDSSTVEPNRTEATEAVTGLPDDAIIPSSPFTNEPYEPSSTERVTISEGIPEGEISAVPSQQPEITTISSAYPGTIRENTERVTTANEDIFSNEVIGSTNKPNGESATSYADHDHRTPSQSENEVETSKPSMSEITSSAEITTEISHPAVSTDRNDVTQPQQQQSVTQVNPSEEPILEDNVTTKEPSENAAENEKPEYTTERVEYGTILSDTENKSELAVSGSSVTEKSESSSAPAISGTVFESSTETASNADHPEHPSDSVENKTKRPAENSGTSESENMKPSDGDVIQANTEANEATTTRIGFPEQQSSTTSEPGQLDQTWANAIENKYQPSTVHSEYDDKKPDHSLMSEATSSSGLDIPQPDREDEDKQPEQPGSESLSEESNPALASSTTSATIAASTPSYNPIAQSTWSYKPLEETSSETSYPSDAEIPSGPESPSDYEEDDTAYGPGTCRYGGKIYVSAQQIPREDPCDFCFCFRSDIICLQQSCPPPIPGCRHETIQGFCCPRYECPVSMAATLNSTSTTSTTTTTTSLPPVFAALHRAAPRTTGCLIHGYYYKVGEDVSIASGPCLDCLCGADSKMKCEPKSCSPWPMLGKLVSGNASTEQ